MLLIRQMQRRCGCLGWGIELLSSWLRLKYYDVTNEHTHDQTQHIRSLYMNGDNQPQRERDSTTHINFTSRILSIYNSTRFRIRAYDLARNTTARLCLPWKSESALSKLGEAHALLQDCLPSSQPDHKITHVERIWEKWFYMLPMFEIQEGVNRDVQYHTRQEPSWQRHDLLQYKNSFRKHRTVVFHLHGVK
jgi:hypothetical protein